MNENDEQKKIEVVSGDGSDLDISPVYDHVNVNRTQQKPKNIIIPKSKPEKSSDEKNSSKDTDESNT